MTLLENIILQDSHCTYSLLLTGTSLFDTWLYGGSGGVWLMGLGHKTHCNFLLALVLGSLVLGEVNCQFLKTLKQPMEEFTW